MNILPVQRFLARWGWLLPLIALVLVLGATYFLDRQNRLRLESARQEGTVAAEREAAALAEAISGEVASRIGALAAAKLQFTQVEDSLSQQTLLAAVDTVIAGVPGLAAVTVIRPDGTVSPSSGALLPRTWAEPLTIPVIEEAFGAAVATGRPAATGVLDLVGGQRFLVFDPVVPPDSGAPRAILAAELEPLAIIRAALGEEREQIRPAFYDVFDGAGRRITTVPSPRGWERVTRPIRVADTDWQLSVSHQPVGVRSFEAVRAAIRISGILLALVFALSLYLLWRTVAAQQGEIARRIEAERRASENAGEAARRAAEARAVTEQLTAAQETALRLVGSPNPEEVSDVFLGAVGEVLGADQALLYGFEEHGEEAVGRRRLVLNPAALPDSVSQDDFKAVRVPVALVPHLAEPISSGEPYLVSGDATGGPSSASAGVTGPSAVLAVPMIIGDHLVGVAVWECFRSDATIDRSAIPFARAVSAQAAGILRAADLLERVRRARQSATREATRLATVLDRLADGVVLFDQDGAPVRVNPAAEALLGPALRETPMQEWPAALSLQQDGHRLGPAEFGLLEALQGQRVDKFRFTARRHGLDRYFAASAAPIRGEEETIRGVAVVVRDVTDEHEYAEMLRHTNDELQNQAQVLERVNDELKAATLAKDQFLAMMSHELRTPINAIIGYADLLEMGIHGALNDEQHQMVNRVVETSRHLLGLVNDVLDLTKIAAGRMDLKIQPVSLRPVLMKAANQLTPLAESKRLELRVHVDDDITLMADETRLAQVVINLASNAVKFTDEGSVTVTGEVDQDRVLIHVRDTGPGIPDEELERVFEEFHQLDAGHARKAGGTGLGLAISRRLTRLMGGDLRVESVLGEGTDFILDLPLARSSSSISRS